MPRLLPTIGAGWPLVRTPRPGLRRLGWRLGDLGRLLSSNLPELLGNPLDLGWRGACRRSRGVWLSSSASMAPCSFSRRRLSCSLRFPAIRTRPTGGSGSGGPAGTRPRPGRARPRQAPAGAWSCGALGAALRPRRPPGCSRQTIDRPSGSDVRGPLSCALGLPAVVHRQFIASRTDAVCLRLPPLGYLVQFLAGATWVSNNSGSRPSMRTSARSADGDRSGRSLNDSGPVLVALGRARCCTSVLYARAEVIPCLQNPRRVSSTVSGLDFVVSTVHRDPARSRLVGVNFGCQPAPAPNTASLRHPVLILRRLLRCHHRAAAASRALRSCPIAACTSSSRFT
jgi:hypothetical protein